MFQSVQISKNLCYAKDKLETVFLSVFGYISLTYLSLWTSTQYFKICIASESQWLSNIKLLHPL